MMPPPHKPLVYIISAPSGSGKSTLVSELLKMVPDLDFSISYTTRPPRRSEQNGKQYFFVSRAEFQQMTRDDEQKGHDLLLDIDVQGARQVKQRLPDAISIFILPPDRKTLEWRLRKRSEDTEEVIQRRLVTATREIENYDKYNYILVNDQLQDSIQSLQAIVRSERLCRPGRTFSEEESKVLELAESCRLANIRDRVQPILASFAAPAVSGGTQ